MTQLSLQQYHFGDIVFKKKKKKMTNEIQVMSLTVL